MTITTKKGDTGITSLADGTRVEKDHLRIELNGQLDELSAYLGLCKAASCQAEPYTTLQRQLMGFMAFVAKPAASLSASDEQRVKAAVAHMEQEMGQRLGDASPFDFVLPGRDLADAAMHLARAKARTCERRMVTLSKVEAVPPLLLTYLNRLSDYLFALAVARP